MGRRTSKDLLHLEQRNPSTSSLESALLVCKTELDSRRKKTDPEEKPMTAPVSQSQVLGKVKDFLGVISEANKRLQLDAKDNSENYDIEVLNGNESQVIEMDLMLGIADLHTSDAVAAAESAIAGYQPVIPLAVGSSESETESDGSSDEVDDSDESDHDEDDDGENQDVKTFSSTKLKRSKSAKDSSSSEVANNKSKKRPKIVEL